MGGADSAGHKFRDTFEKNKSKGLGKRFLSHPNRSHRFCIISCVDFLMQR